MSTRPLGALASIVPLLALSGVPATADAEERSAVEEVLDDVGLFKSTIDVDSLDRGEDAPHAPRHVRHETSIHANPTEQTVRGSS